MEKQNVSFALQLYSVRAEMQNDFGGTLEKVKELGYEGVEFAGLYDNPAGKVKAILGDLALEPVAAHVPIGEMLAAPDRTMDIYYEIGCRFIAVPWLDEARRPGGGLYQKTVEDIENLSIAAKNHGLTLLYHNHDFEFAKINGRYALDIMYENIGHLMTELDTCWIAVAGENPADYIKKYAGRAPVVHLKDYYLSGKKPQQMYELIGIEQEKKEGGSFFEFRPLGKGMQDFKEIMEAVKTAQSKWCVVEQDEPSMGLTPMQCAGSSLEYITNL